VRTIDELLHDLAPLSTLAGDHLTTIAGCAINRVFVPGEAIMTEGETADAFHVIRRGVVAIETRVPGRGAVTLETLHDGDVLGWSWLVPPYRTAFDARSLGTTHVISLDGACLRAKCQSDPGLGYDLLRLLAAVFTERLRDARLRLLDLYGAHGG
jgi:CRP/FNR family transcriptional regulator, cyclic AMP receptor protein